MRRLLALVVLVQLAAVSAGAQQVQVVTGAGSDLATIKAPSTPPVATDTAIVVTARDAAPPGSTARWTCGLNALAASLTQCQAAPSAGQRLYLTGLYVQTTTTTSGTYALQTGTGTNCATGTAALFPVSGTANRFNAPISTTGPAMLEFSAVPLVAPTASALCVIGVATNTIAIQLVGFTAP